MLAFILSILKISDVAIAVTVASSPKTIGKGDLLNGVARPQTNPLRDRTVLSLGFSKLLLGAETLVALSSQN